MLQWFGPFEAPSSNSKWKVLCFGPPTAHRHLPRAHKWVMTRAVGNNTRTWQICPSNIHYIVSNQKHQSLKEDGLNNEPRFLQHWLSGCQSKFAHFRVSLTWILIGFALFETSVQKSWGELLKIIALRDTLLFTFGFKTPISFLGTFFSFNM